VAPPQAEVQLQNSINATTVDSASPNAERTHAAFELLAACMTALPHLTHSLGMIHRELHAAVYHTRSRCVRLVTTAGRLQPHLLRADLFH